MISTGFVEKTESRKLGNGETAYSIAYFYIKGKWLLLRVTQSVYTSGYCC